MAACTDIRYDEAQTGRVAICLASYNGVKYISQQLDSILEQSFSNWVLFIRDDGSIDGTPEIIADYVKQHPGKIVLVEDEKALHDCSLNFFELLRHAHKYPQFEYFMFCDQDDVWNSNKIELEIDEIVRKEQLCAAGTPALVITDCSIVNERLEVIHPSLGANRPFRAGEISLVQCLVNNVGQGATMLLNRTLASEVLAFNLETSLWMYDYLVMITALGLGVVSYLDVPTMKYRQHGANVSGANNYHRSLLDGVVHIVKDPSIFNGWIRRLVGDEEACVARARSVLRCFGGRLSQEDLEAVASLATINEKGRSSRLKIMREYKLQRQSTFYERAYQLASVFLAKRKKDE